MASITGVLKQQNIKIKSPDREKEDTGSSLKGYLTTSIPVIVLILITVFFQIVSDGRLLSGKNISALLNSMFSIVLGATGVAFLMAQGNLDFSLGGIVGLTAVLSGYAAELNPVLSVLTGVLAGCACGFINGIVHSRFHVSSIITTLSTAYIFRGIQCTLITSGSVGLPASMMKLENTTLKVVLIIIFFAVGAVLYNRTRFGKYCRAIGSREEASYQSGIRITRMKIGCFILSGAIAGLVGFFYLVRAASASANTGAGFEFDVLLALLLGGMPISGGAGARFRTVLIGSLIMTILSNGMILWGLDSVLQQFIRGIIFLVSVSISFDRRNVTVIE
ncbi:ABC transporter permease [Murimonas intestini]|uniref:ABC transporter permease n=1 Tax=Murimonas intestini TaxID=1337051 RepID=UPI0011DD4779|nr:ABC transporter permease [Murimonas intestini]